MLAALLVAPALAVLPPGDAPLTTLGEYGATVGIIFLLLEIAKRAMDKIPGLRDQTPDRMESAIRDHQGRADASFEAVQESLHRLEDQVISRVNDMVPLLHELAKTAAVQQRILEQISTAIQQTSSATIVLTEILRNKEK